MATGETNTDAKFGTMVDVDVELHKGDSNTESPSLFFMDGEKMERQDMFNKIRAIDGKCSNIRNEFDAIENVLNTLHYDTDEDITSLYSEHPYTFVFDLFIRINEEFDFGLEEVYTSYLSNETIKVENLQKMYLTLYKLLSNEYKNLLAERETLVELI